APAALRRLACVSAELPHLPQRALDRSHVYPARARSSDPGDARPGAAGDDSDQSLSRVVRILLVTPYFWPESFLINDVVAGLVERGHEVMVYTGLPNYPGGRFFDGYGFFGPFKENYKGAEVRRAPLIPRGS